MTREKNGGEASALAHADEALSQASRSFNESSVFKKKIAQPSLHKQLLRPGS